MSVDPIISATRHFMNAFDSLRSPEPVQSFRDRPLLVETVRSSDAQNDQTAAVDLCNLLRPYYDTRLLWLEDDKWNARNQINAVQLNDDAPGLLDQIRSVFERMRPTFVHTHRLEELEIVGRAARKAGVPYLVHSLNSDFLKAGRDETGKLSSLVQELSPVMISSDPAIASSLHGSVEVQIIPTGIDCNRYIPGDQEKARRRVGLPADPKIIGCSISLSDISHLVHALFQLEPDVHLALFGKARLDRTERDLIRKLGLEERIHVLGAWARPELTFQAIDIYFHGPSQENPPRAILAAQACGKPVIACAPTHKEALCPRSGRLIPTYFKPTLLHNIRRSLAFDEQETPRGFALGNWDISSTSEIYADLFRRSSSGDVLGRRLA